MEKLRIETTHYVSHFSDVAEKCQKAAKKENIIIEFDFNEVTCLVSPKTNTDNLFRDFCHAHLMGWKTIGPDCDSEYSVETKNEIKEREIKREERIRIETDRYRKKQSLEKAKILELASSEILSFQNDPDYLKWKNKNTDAYGNACFEYAEMWAKLMQIEFRAGRKIKVIAEESSYKLDYLGITGFMYGMAVSILSIHWKYGEELKQWHNEKYGQPSESGVVNPAIITLKVKSQ